MCSTSERFILSLGVKGAQWLEIRDVGIRSSHCSLCTHEFEVSDSSSIAIDARERACPPLKVLSLRVATITPPDTNQSVVCGASVSVYEGVSVDGDTESGKRRSRRMYCWLCPAMRFPPQLESELSKQKLHPQLMRNERELLLSLLDCIASEDADVVVGHNNMGNDLPVLQSRLRRAYQ